MATNTEAKTRMKAPTPESKTAIWQAGNRLNLAWGFVIQARDHISKSDYEAITNAFKKADAKLTQNYARMNAHIEEKEEKAATETMLKRVKSLDAEKQAKLAAMLAELEKEEVVDEAEEEVVTNDE